MSAATTLGAAPGRTSLRGGLIGSAVVHGAALVMLWVIRSAPPPALPPVYRVELVGAPAAAQPASVAAPVTDATVETPPATSAPPAPVAAPVPAARTVPVKKANKPPAKAPPKAAPKAPAKPSASGNAKAPPVAAPPGPVAASTGGGAGTDVATIRTEGIAFPFPGYLQNIVRQVAVRFRPRNPAAPLKADVAFLIHRDGSVSNVRFVTRSGSYAFDLEAQGAIEAAASSKAFGPLPTGFPDDVLPVTFAFDPRVVR